jgi:uncharacterized linocin/CFP29 family protein
MRAKTTKGIFSTANAWALARQSILDHVWRPEYFNANGLACNAKGDLTRNAYLNEKDWSQLDKAIARRVSQRINVLDDLAGPPANLERDWPIGAYESEWGVSSERIEADVTLEFGSAVDSDRTDTKYYAVPVPIIHTTYDFGRRELETYSLNGRPIETTEAEEATVAVVEKVEDTIINGNTDVNVGGNTIPGLRTLAARTTGTAAAFGGGDFGTISNILDTFLGVFTTLSGNRYYGPFNVYIANTQYIEMLNRYTDGTGMSALQVIENLPFINFVKVNDLMPAGEMVWYQPEANVIDLLVAMGMENMRWEAPDQSRVYFAVMWAGVARLKTDYAGNAGIAHVTSC